VLHALHEHGVPIPEAVSVIAMPDVWLAAYCWPPLTTVDMPLGVMGGRAVDLLTAMVAGERPERVVVTSPRPRIVMRSSVGPVSAP
jgi:DNA-binding LacI/PurR family transcriptional regulator